MCELCGESCNGALSNVMGGQVRGIECHWWCFFGAAKGFCEERGHEALCDELSTLFRKIMAGQEK